MIEIGLRGGDRVVKTACRHTGHIQESLTHGLESLRTASVRFLDCPVPDQLPELPTCQLVSKIISFVFSSLPPPPEPS